METKKGAALEHSLPENRVMQVESAAQSPPSGRVPDTGGSENRENHVGGGEKGRQFGGREGARCGVTLWTF